MLVAGINITPRSTAKIVTRWFIGSSAFVAVDKAFEAVVDTSEMPIQEKMAYKTGSIGVAYAVSCAIDEDTDELIDYLFDAAAKRKAEKQDIKNDTIDHKED